MKKLLTIAAIAAATTALAVESSNTFGILRVDSTAAQTIVSVPWLAAGGGDIDVANVVKTANLHNGDKLHYYNTTTKKYRVWELTDGAWVEAKDAQDPVVAAPTLSRGNAIILERTAPIAGSFYLYGQYAALTAGDTTTVAPGSVEVPAYTLLAPPTTESFNLNGTGVMTGTTDAADRIAVPNADGLSLALLKYDSANGGWGIKKSTFDKSKATIPAGQGVWYVSRGGSPTFNWNPSAQ